jgi:hypothetical protein
MLQEYQKIIVTNHVPSFQKKAFTESQCLAEINNILEQINIKLSEEINSEIKRLGKYGGYEDVIFFGGDFAMKLSFWNKHIPNLKAFLKDSFEKVGKQMIRSLDYDQILSPIVEKSSKSNEYKKQLAQGALEALNKPIWISVIIIVIFYLLKYLSK